MRLSISRVSASPNSDVGKGTGSRCTCSGAEEAGTVVVRRLVLESRPFWPSHGDVDGSLGGSCPLNSSCTIAAAGNSAFFAYSTPGGAAGLRSCGDRGDVFRPASSLAVKVCTLCIYSSSITVEPLFFLSNENMLAALAFGLMKGPHRWRTSRLSTLVCRRT